MEKSIKGIIDEIPSDTVFDSHAIIQRLLQDHTDEYLSNSNGLSTELYHGAIGKIIATFEGDLIERIGSSWSKNIKDKFSICTSWKKV